MNLRMLAVVAAGLAYGVTAAVRIAPITPSVDIRVLHSAHNDRWDGFMVVCKARGAEPVEELAIEAVSGPVRLVGNTSMKSLPDLWRVSFEVQLDRTGEKGVVRVVQRGNTPKSYLVELPVDAP